MRGQFLALLAVGLWAAPAPSVAQVSLGTGQAPGISVQWNAPSPPPPPSPSTSQATGGFSARPSTGVTDQFLADEHTYAPRYDRQSQLHGRPRVRRGYVSGYGYGYGVGYGGPLPYAYEAPMLAPVNTRTSVATSQGRLALSVTPGSAQVLVDGFYVGVVDDFDDRGLWLEPGPRRIELRADGYDTATFDVRIVDGETVRYQRNLARLSPRGTERRVEAAQKQFYVISGCYAGDTPPSAARLPAGCRAADVRVIPTGQ